MKKLTLIKNAAVGLFVMCVNSCTEVTPLTEEPKEIKDVVKVPPQEPGMISEPTYFFDDYTIKTKLNDWLKYLAYHKKIFQNAETTSLIEDEQDDETALMLAAALGDIQIMKELIRCGANVNHTTRIYHETALHYAAYKGKMEAYAFLVKNGAKQDIKSIDTATLAAQGEEDCAFAGANQSFLKERNFKLRTPRQLLQRRISEALSGKYKESLE